MRKYDAFYEEDYQDIVLADGENILWQGKPKKSAFIVNSILPMMPVTLLWLAIDVFFISTFLSAGGFGDMAFFIIPFFAVHLIPVWKWIGDVLSSSRKWENTKYCVTDKRIIIQSGFISSNINSIYYKDIQNVNLHIGVFDRMFGVGDIIISSRNDYMIYNTNTNTNVKRPGFAILDIENPHATCRKIQKIVLDIQTDIEFPNEFRPKTNSGYNTTYKG